MKFLILIASLILAVSSKKEWSEPEVAEWVKIRKECQASTQVDQKLLDQLPQGIYENDQKLKKYIMCTQLANGFVDSNGNIHPEILKLRWSGHFDDATLDRIIKNCAFKKDTPEETAFQFAKCSHREKNNKN